MNELIIEGILRWSPVAIMILFGIVTIQFYLWSISWLNRDSKEGE